MDLLKLDAPFPSRDIEWRAQSCGEKTDGTFWIICLAYVTNRAIMNRLDSVCGKENWRNEYRDIPSGGVECGISIKINNEWVTKWDAAEETQVEAVKGGRSGAMKRAAVQWGIGRYLYDIEEGFGVVSDRGKMRAQTKSGKKFRWNPPLLPDWALPDDEKGQTNKQHENQRVVKIDLSQITALENAIVEKGYSVPSVCAKWKIGSLAEIEKNNFNSIIAAVNNWPAAKAA